ncbi:hydrophobin-251 [Mycena rebaudengoi]|nr:hydrophobin-251 [Mycena rebaudengoi]
MLFRLSLACGFASLLVCGVSAAPHSNRGCSALCCSQVGNANDPSIKQLLGLLGVVATGQVGVQCAPLGRSCSGRVACCKNINNGLIASGC